MPECYIRGSTIKYLRIPDEVIDMVKEEVVAKGRGRSDGKGRGGAQRGGRGGSRGGNLFQLRTKLVVTQSIFVGILVCMWGSLVPSKYLDGNLFRFWLVDVFR